MDEDPLALAKFGAIDEALPRCKGADGYGGGYGVRQVCGLRSYAAGLRDAEFRERAIGVPVVHAVDFLADAKIANLGTDCSDGAAEFVRWDRVCARGAILC